MKINGLAWFVLASGLGLLLTNNAVFGNTTNSSNINESHSNQAISQTTPEENPILTPDAALQRLMDGNKRFASDTTTCPERNQMRRLATAAKQKPFAIILGCSDSRIPPEIAFDQGIGDIFVVRVAGNVVSAIELSSVEYSALVNQSNIILVLGHQSCGAVQAVLDNQTKGIEAIANLIKPSLIKLKKNKDASKSEELVQAIESNVLQSVQKIKQSKAIANLINNGKIKVVGSYYDFGTGQVRLLQEKS